MLIEGLCLRCFTVIYSSLTRPQHVYFGTLVTIFYQEHRLHQLVPTLHQLHLGPPAVTFLDKWLSYLHRKSVYSDWQTELTITARARASVQGGEEKNESLGSEYNGAHGLIAIVSLRLKRKRQGQDENLPRMVSSERDVRCEYLWRGFNYTWGRLVRRSS